jgi:nucleoside-diphosphate-sugar epimerase
MQVLVMGGTQFNGLALVRELARHGHRVAVLNRGRTKAELPRSVERLVADRTDFRALADALGGRAFDAVVDVSAYRVEDVRFMAEHLRGRTGHYVFVSSTVIYAAADLLPICEDHPVERGPRQNEYGLQKLRCEDLLLQAWREHGFPASVVALSMVFGPNNIIPDREQRMFARLLQGREILIPGDGTTLAQVGHVDDQARAFRMLLGRPQTFGRRYNLTGADCFTAEGYVDLFAEVLGREARKVFVPPDLMDAFHEGRLPLEGGGLRARVETRTGHGDALARAQFQLSCLVQRIAPYIHGWRRNVFFGIDRLRQDVGFEPAISFPAAVEHTWRWYRDSGLAEESRFDFSWEDRMLERIREAEASR